MTQRDLIFTAIKILGLCLVVFGLLAAWSEGVAAYFSHRIIEQQTIEQQEQQKGTTGGWRSEMSLAVQEIQRVEHLSKLAYRVVEVLVGLYLCRRGTAVLNFLVGGRQDRQAEPPLSPRV